MTLVCAVQFEVSHIVSMYVKSDGRWKIGVFLTECEETWTSYVWLHENRVDPQLSEAREQGKGVSESKTTE